MKQTILNSVFTIAFLFFLLTGCSVPAGEGSTPESSGTSDIVEDVLGFMDLGANPPSDKNQHYQ